MSRFPKFPDVPNWVQWITAFAGLLGGAVILEKILPNWLQVLAASAIAFGISVMAVRLLWRRYFSDKWANMSRTNAIAKARNLIVQFRIVNELRQDERRFQAISTTVIADILIAISLTAIGAALFYIPYLLFNASFQIPFHEGSALLGNNETPPSIIKKVPTGILAIVIAASGAMAMIGAFIRMGDAIYKQETLVRPLTDWEAHFNRTFHRIETLLTKAGMNENEQANFINNLIIETEDEVENDQDTVNWELTPARDEFDPGGANPTIIGDPNGPSEEDR